MPIWVVPYQLKIMNLRLIGDWRGVFWQTLGTIQLTLIKIGARLVRHARGFTFQLAEVAVTGSMINSILEVIDSLRPPPQRA